jgi:hypothetical protein
LVQFRGGCGASPWGMRGFESRAQFLKLPKAGAVCALKTRSYPLIGKLLAAAQPASVVRRQYSPGRMTGISLICFMSSRSRSTLISSMHWPLTAVPKTALRSAPRNQAPSSLIEPCINDLQLVR